MSKDGKPDLKFIARQLSKPSGKAASAIAQKMDGSNEFLYDLTVETLKPQNGESILEIGFGSGAYMHRLFAEAEDIKVRGIDLSSDMVALAKSNNQEFIESGKLELENGSSDNLPYGDGEFDKVFCNMVVFFWDEPAKHLKEVRRVLKSGGKFYTGIRTKASMKQFPFVKFGFNLYEPDEWRGVLEQNGFVYVKEERKLDPPLQSDGQTINLESVCIVAEKENEVEKVGETAI